MKNKWKTIRVLEEDFNLLGALKRELRKKGVASLPERVQADLANISSGSIVAASLHLLRDHIQEKAAHASAEKILGKAKKGVRL